MLMLLMKSIPESIRKNFGTYILLTLFVTVGMYLASATAGITYSYDTAYKEIARVSNIEDGQFQTSEQLEDSKEKQIIDEGAVLYAFGYSGIELTLEFIGKLIVFSIISAAVCLPAGYYFSKLMMPEFVASTPIGLMIDYHMSEYLINFAIVVIIIGLSAIPGLIRIINTNSLYYLRSRE